MHIEGLCLMFTVTSLGLNIENEKSLHTFTELAHVHTFHIKPLDAFANIEGHESDLEQLHSACDIAAGTLLSPLQARV